MGEAVQALDGQVRGSRLLTRQMAVFIAAHASGKAMTRVAEEMHYSYANVRNTLDEAKSRAGCGTLAQLVLYAHREGYITHPTGPDNIVFVCAPT